MFEATRDRFAPKKESKVPFMDLDAIISETHYVKFMGEIHELKPILVEEFFALANAWVQVQDVVKSDKVTMDQAVNAYYALIFPVCPTITKTMILGATHAQIAALIGYVNEHVNGKISDEKKKSLLTNLAPTFPKTSK